MFICTADSDALLAIFLFYYVAIAQSIWVVFFIEFIQKYLISSLCVPEIVLGSGDSRINKMQSLLLRTWAQ